MANTGLVGIIDGLFVTPGTIMLGMARKKPEASDKPKKRPPSRDKLRNLVVPDDYYEGLAKYAERESDADTKRSVSWAGRVAIRRFLQSEGLIP